MLVPVAVLTVLAVVGGWIQFSPLWHPLTNWLEPVARTLGIAEPTSWQDALSSALAVLLGLGGIAVAWAMYGTGRIAIPSFPRVQRALEHKLYFDEAYDVLFARPAIVAARHLRDHLEQNWLVSAPVELGNDTMSVGRGVRRLQTGLLRTYVLFLGTGMAVTAIVFLVVR